MVFRRALFRVHCSFIIFINHFPNCSNFFDFTLFADITLSCRYENNATTLLSNIFNNELSNVFNGISANKLKVDTEKCKLIHFSYRQNLKLPPTKINSSCIYQTDSIKFLGIIIDKNLNFKQRWACSISWNIIFPKRS